MIAHILMSYAGGPVAMGMQLLQQVALYSTPAFMHQASLLYYKLKPLAHNHAHWLVEDCLDKAASLSANTVMLSFKGMRLLDYATNPTRCGVGFATSQLLANLASYYTDNKDAQAAMLFLGREAGFMAVDAYQQYDANLSESGAYEHELNRALTIWGSILGKTYGESFVYGIHAVTQFKNELYQAVGWTEHSAITEINKSIEAVRKRLTGLESYKRLESMLQQSEELLKPLQGYFLSSQLVFQKFRSIQEEINYWRERTLQEIEGWVYKTIVPDSNYQKYATFYLLQAKLAMLQHRVLDAERELKYSENMLAETSPASTNLSELQRNHEQSKMRYQALQLEANQCREELNVVWESTPKAAQLHLMKDAHENEFVTRMKLEEKRLDKEFKEGHDANNEDVESASVALEEATIEHQKSVDLSISAEIKMIEVLTSIEEKDLDISSSMFHNGTERAAEIWTTEQYDLIQAYDCFVQYEKELAQAKIQLQKSEALYQAAQQNHDINENMIYAIDQLNGNKDIVWDEHKLSNAVQNKTSDEFANAAIDVFVNLGVIERDHAISRMYDTFKRSVDKTRHNKLVHSTAQFNNKVKEVKSDYRAMRVSMGTAFLEKLNEAKSNYIALSENVDQLASKADLAREKYLNLTPVETREKYLSQFECARESLERARWESTHNIESIHQIIVTIGQPEIAIGAFLQENEQAIENHLGWYLARSASVWLAEYKHLFLSFSNFHSINKDRNEMFSEFRSKGVDPSTIAEQKSRIDEFISEQILQDARNYFLDSQRVEGTSDNPELIVNRILYILDRGMGRLNRDPKVPLGVGGKPLSTLLTESLSMRSDDETKRLIYQALQENTKSESINVVGQWTPPPPPPPVQVSKPRKKKWYNKALDVVKYIANEILKNGGGGNVSSDGVSIGARGYEHFNIYRFNHQAQNILNIKQQTPSQYPTIVRNGPNINTSSAEHNHFASMMPYPRLIEILENDGVSFPTPSNSANDIITNVVTPSVQSSSTILPVSLASPVAQMVREARYQPFNNPVYPLQERASSQQAMTATSVLNYFVSTSNASISSAARNTLANAPIMPVRQASQTNTSSISTNFARLNADGTRSDYGFPIYQHEPNESSFPIHNEVDGLYEGMPIEQALGQRLGTPIHHVEPNFTSLPIFTQAAILYMLRRNYSHNSEYVPNEKHRQAAPREVSIDPFYYQPEKAEKLLHEALEKRYQSKNGKQYYSPIRDINGDLHVFVFQPTHNDNREYHGYLYETTDGKRSINEDILNVAKIWREDGSISKTEYKKMVNNKMNWAKGSKKEFR
ncbi:MAG: hypothetical protein U1E78_12310 [Gammaproteobacteria bacterium]